MYIFFALKFYSNLEFTTGWTQLFDEAFNNMPVKEGVAVEGSAVVEVVSAEVVGGEAVVDVCVVLRGDGDRLAIGSAGDS